MKKRKSIAKSIAIWSLGVLTAFSLAGGAKSLTRASATVEGQTPEDTYLLPINGYADLNGYSALEGTTFSVWMATNYGIGHEGIWSGLGQYSFDGWQPFAGSVTEEQKLQILNDMCDHILINGKTMSEIRVENGKSAEISTAVGGTAMGRVIFGYYGEGKIALRFHTSSGDGSCLSAAQIETVTIKEGFQWYSNAGAKLGTTTDQDYTMYYDQANNQMVRQLKTDENGEIAADAITMTKGPDKTLYFKGDTFDKTGLSFTVKYADKDASGKNRTETIPADKVIVGDCDFNGDEAGKVKVPVYVNGAEYEVEVDYNPKQVDISETALAGITIEGLKETYVMETDRKVSGLTLKNVKFTDGTTADIALTDECINAPVVYEGKCKGSISYLNLEGFKFEYNVSNVDSSTPISLSIDATNYPIFHATVNNRLGVKVTIPGSTTSRKAIENVQLAKWLDREGNEVSIGDFIYINGVSFTQLFSEHKIRKILAYGDTLLFDVYTNKSEVSQDKVPAEYIDSETGMPIGYLTYDSIFTIEFKPGFAYVTANADSWGLGTSEADSAKYFPVPGGYLKESVLLVRYPATSSLTRWMRPLSLMDGENKMTSEKMVSAVLELAKTPDEYTKSALDALMSNVASDAAVVTSSGITEFKVGEDYDATGLEVTVKYLDGGSEVMTFNSAAIQGFDSGEAGTCACYVTVNNIRVSFTVTIKEASPETPDSSSSSGGAGSASESTGGGCGSSLGGASLLLASAAIAVGCVILKKKRA